ncbi:hypothetical protein B0H66DRAFT_291720 [Apodospora peruviana]|uniref:Uncharacterized protein n=1 Tax=Apodospora peruviana TaxID=516989 RepID=A0AAE0I0U3_9PEZI|nr:hypothetical protein B0H66DRAFT_291720 [Apodospora peruviana]
MPGFCRRWAARRAGRRRAGNQQDERDNEKYTKKPPNKLDASATAVRVFHIISASCVWASLALLLHSITPGALGDHSRPIPTRHIRNLSHGALLYPSGVLVFLAIFRRLKKSAAWRVFAVGTVLGDLLMMGLAIAMITVLSAVGLPAGCRVLKANFHGVGQIFASYSHAFFGLGAEENVEDLGLLCTLPNIVYTLTVLSIFSHTVSIVLTILQFQRNLSLRTSEPRTHAGHVEEAIPTMLYDRASTQHQSSTPSPPPSPPPRGYIESTISTVYQQLTDNDISTRTAASTLPARLSNPVPQYSPPRSNWENPTRNDPPAEVFSNPPDWRSSQETTSSFNPDLYLVSDGFRPLPEPPAYTSRPSSLYDGRA